jgi:UDP-N-acetylglucosamine diphosphorylase / glucose-1-phosphate thymidylyltransferase / UDP-N-acetylgalactosamine diphosphorylase / glucosamine-1-phosphate N-acetyltransferase / galactosamine-1-phosphate N-acetyltransferase
MIKWVLYDDPGAQALRPLTYLRPASALLLGAATTEARWRALAAGETVQIVCRKTLVPLAAGRLAWEDARSPRGGGLWDEDTRWVSDLLLTNEALRAGFAEMPADSVAYLDGRLAGWRPGRKTRALLEDAGVSRLAVAELLRGIGQAAPTRVELDGARLTGLGDLIRFQERVLVRDLTRLLGQTQAAGIGDGFAYGADAIRLGSGCRVDHGAVLDAREGPIVLEEGCEVFPHTWIRGPFHAGAGCRLLGGRIGGGSSLGPQCRVRGEVEASVFLGFDNKAHDGFVGHSYLGEWVNLGALTTTSDLKNNYSAITLEGEDGREDTGLTKLGVFLGDHVKTRIGCLLTCGTVVGLGANLFGDPAVAERRIPDFRWGGGKEGKEYEINKFLQTAETVVGRRGIPLTPAMTAALREAHRMSRPGEGGGPAVGAFDESRGKKAEGSE